MICPCHSTCHPSVDMQSCHPKNSDNLPLNRTLPETDSCPKNRRWWTLYWCITVSWKDVPPAKKKTIRCAGYPCCFRNAGPADEQRDGTKPTMGIPSAVFNSSCLLSSCTLSSHASQALQEEYSYQTCLSGAADSRLPSAQSCSTETCRLSFPIGDIIDILFLSQASQYSRKLLRPVDGPMGGPAPALPGTV